MATSSTVYVGGTFGKVGKSKRSRLAAISAVNGKPRSWKPAANGDVLALTLTPDRRSLVAGGSFSKIGRSSACGMSRLSLSGGAVQSWPINSVVRNCGDGTAILSLTADATRVYGSGYNYRGKGNYEGVFAATGAGRLSWLQDCRGDTYDVAVAAGRVYSVGHAHNCANIGGFPETKPRANYRALAVTTTATGTVGTLGGRLHRLQGQAVPVTGQLVPEPHPGDGHRPDPGRLERRGRRSLRRAGRGVHRRQRRTAAGSGADGHSRVRSAQAGSAGGDLRRQADGGR